MIKKTKNITYTLFENCSFFNKEVFIIKTYKVWKIKILNEYLEFF